MSGTTLGDLFGDFLVMGALFWGADKVSKALKSKNLDLNLDNTEPL